MKWVKSSDYSIKSSDGRFHIARAICSGVDKFTLWDGQRIIGTWSTPEAAKQVAVDFLATKKTNDAVCRLIEQSKSLSNDSGDTCTYTNASNGL